MLDLLKALVALRLATMVLMAGGALVLLAVWSLSHGAPDTGIAVLTGVALCFAAAAAALRRRTRHR